MVLYLSVLFILLLCISLYDIRGQKQYQKFVFRLILLILILISGLSYRLGGDGIIYVKEYKQYGDITDLSFSYLMSFRGRMPGWVFLCTLCKSITISHWLFKLVHAIILNFAYFSLLKKNAKYVFTGLLFYYVLLYFNQNFLFLRESLAVSFFFFSLPSFFCGKWLKYYLFVIIALSFHEGATFLLFLPLIKIIGLNKISFFIYLFLGILFIRFASDVLELLIGVQVDGEVQAKISHYNSELDTQYQFTYWGNSLLNIFFPLLIIYYYYKNKIDISYLYPSVIGIILYVMSLVVPIFYRLTNYCLIFNYILIADFIISRLLSMKIDKWLQLALTYIFLIIFLCFKGRMYFLNSGASNIPAYVQFYPYASVFEKYEDPTRERLYRIRGD